MKCIVEAPDWSSKLGILVLKTSIRNHTFVFSKIIVNFIVIDEI